jgi:hypothetical protein
MMETINEFFRVPKMLEITNIKSKLYKKLRKYSLKE